MEKVVNQSDEEKHGIEENRDDLQIFLNRWTQKEIFFATALVAIFFGIFSVLMIFQSSQFVNHRWFGVVMYILLIFIGIYAFANFFGYAQKAAAVEQMIDAIIHNEPSDYKNLFEVRALENERPLKYYTNLNTFLHQRVILGLNLVHIIVIFVLISGGCVLIY